MSVEPTSASTDELVSAVRAILAVLEDQVLGHRAAAEELLVAYMAGGHALVQGVPGIGKTRLARAFAAVSGLELKRIQFTPDLMPADVIGTNVFDPASSTFRLAPGPVFTAVLMADEINRTPPKTQAALLEAMQEGQVTIDGQPHVLPETFFVIATQNPVEFEGTYPLPEAQSDRFLVRIEMGLPAAAAELALYRRALSTELTRWRAESQPPPVITAAQAVALRHASHRTHVSDELLRYLQQLVESVRASPLVELGVSPRGALALLESCRAAAWLEARDFVTPDDIQRFVAPCWRHRLLLTAEAELEGQAPATVLQQAVAAVPVPRS